MKNLLHILTQPPAPYVRRLIEAQARSAEARVEVADLTQPEPDYDRVIEQVFEADGVAVW
jgi:hypothetical protein